MGVASGVGDLLPVEERAALCREVDDPVGLVSDDLVERRVLALGLLGWRLRVEDRRVAGVQTRLNHLIAEVDRGGGEMAMGGVIRVAHYGDGSVGRHG